MVAASQSALKVPLPLAGRGNKQVGAAELIQRLTTLSEQLIDVEQDDPLIKGQLEKTFAPQLVDKNLLQHKDKGVKSYVAVCIVEALRICAPDAPFSASQLKDIFELFLKQFKLLESNEQAYYSNSVHILKILEQTKCVVIITDIGNASTSLISSFFKTFFDLVKPSMNKDIEHLMTSILSHIIDESESVPVEVIEIILSQFMRKQPPKEKKKDQTDITSLTGIGGYPAAYTMAKGLCQDCADHLSRDVCAYFSDILLPDNTDEDINLEDLEKAHYLVNELYLASPHILSNTIPLLEAELQIENTNVRSLATECVGRMAGARVSSANFSITYASCWHAWLNRRNDRDSKVRVKWIEALPDILANNPDVVADLSGKLNELTFVPDDKVRLAALKVYGALSYPVLLSRIGRSSLEVLADRVKDKKAAIRLEAMQVLARMWNFAYPDIASGQVAATETFSWIPSALLSVMYTDDRDVTAALYKVLYTSLIPLSITDDKMRTHRLLLFVSQLDSRSAKAFEMFPRRQKQAQNYLSAYLTLAEKFNGGIVEPEGMKAAVSKKLDEVCTSVAALVSSVENVPQRKADLKKFAEHNDRRSFKLLRDLIDPSKDAKTLRKIQKEVLQRIEEVAPSLLTTFTPLICQSGLCIWNKTTVENLITALSEKDLSDSSKRVAHILLKHLAATHSTILKDFVPVLAEWIASQSKQASPDRSREEKEAVEDVLKALSRLEEEFDLPSKLNKEFVEALKIFALEGESERQGRSATTILLKLPRRNAYAEDLVEEIVPSLDFESPYFVNRLGSLSKLMILASDNVEKRADDIIDTCIKGILMQCHDPLEGGEEWIEDSDLGVECRAKILALKILANRLRSNIDPQTAEALAKPVLRLLGTLVQSGELRLEEDTPVSTRARLRLAAGLIVLKLCATKLSDNTAVYDAMFTPKSFNLVSLLPQDDCPEVRHGFLEALRRALQTNQLSTRWFTLCFLTAFEPNEGPKETMMRWLKNRADIYRSNKAPVLERTFARLLHLLAHHTDFSTEEGDLDDMVTYLNYFLDCVGTADNYAYFFHIAQRVKQVRDGLEDDKSQNLYILSELAQEVIRLRANAYDWVLVTHPKKEHLPTELFAPLRSPAAAQEIARKQYLSAEFIEALPTKMKRGSRSAPRRPKPKPLKLKTNVQGKAPKSPKSPPSPTAKKRTAPSKTAVPKKAKVERERQVSGERRTSGRHRKAAKYVETGDSTDDQKMDIDDQDDEEAESMVEVGA